MPATMLTQVRRFLGRTRLGINFALGRQKMAKGVTSYDDDWWIVSYPRSGNTWTRFLIANLVAHDEADWTNIERLVPDLYLNSDPQLFSLPRPRYIKSHEAYQPNYRRVVLIVRDPRDVALSYLRFMQKSHVVGLDESIEGFVPRFIRGEMDSYGSWGENVGSWLGARRGTADFLVVRYEDMQRDTIGELSKIAQAMHIDASEDLLRRAVENSSADRMRALEQAQRRQHKYLSRSRADIPFVRTATSGNWMTELPSEVARQIETAWSDRMRELGYVSKLA